MSFSCGEFVSESFEKHFQKFKLERHAVVVMISKEVITFQLGNYSNYIGAHWWNIQESYFQYDSQNPSEIHHDVLFREGKSLKGHVTFTPRAILIDKAENMANIPILSETPLKSQSVTPENSENVTIHEQAIPEKHEFIRDLEKMDKGQRVDIAHKDYKFEETVRTWTDYLKTKYHPKSVVSFQSLFDTDIFHSGVDIYNNLEDDIIERIRSYMEECDNLQGFQLLADATNGFGGLAGAVLLHLQDEYSRKTVFTLPVIPGHYSKTSPVDDAKRMINILLSYQKLTENSSLLVPLGTNTTAWRSLGPATKFPHIIHNNRNLYHSSAILASFLDTVTLKYRLRDEQNCMYDLVSGLNYYNKKVCAATMSLPFPMASQSFLLDTLENLDDSLPLWNTLTPGCNVSNDAIFYQRITVRGIPATRLRNLSVASNTSRASSCASVEELIHMYLSYRLTAISDVISTSLPLKTLVPYPKIFSPHVTPTGAVDESSRRMDNYDVDSCPVITGLHCCKAVGHMLDSLHQNVKSLNVKKFHEFFGGRMDLDEFNECLEKVLAMGYGNASDVELR